MTIRRVRVALLSGLAFGLCFASAAWAGPGACTVPDNGSGTANLPPVSCAYLTPDDDLFIIDGLPPGTTIRIDGVLGTFSPPSGGVCSFLTPPNEQPGGTLGGDKACSNAVIEMPMVGTGTLVGFNRMINVPISLEMHMGPRMLGAPVQSFDTDMFRIFGQIVGDPDFDLLRITGGTDFGLPSPGHTTLAQLPGGNWAVDSFFDITYRIDFVGHPGGPLSGRSGSTTGTIRMATPEVPGACCNRATGACAVVTASACASLGGEPRAPGTTCFGVTCVPVGACCHGLLCNITTRIACGTGRYLGDGTTCICPGGANVCCPADFNNSGTIGVQDIFDFLAAYFGGCP